MNRLQIEAETPAGVQRPRARLPRRIVAVLVGIASLVAVGSIVKTAYFVSRSREQTGVILAREHAGFRSWKITVGYRNGEGRKSQFAARGNYDGRQYAPGTPIMVRVADGEARLGDFQDVWLTSAFTLVFCFILFWLYSLLD